jgi:hypothetical protein
MREKCAWGTENRALIPILQHASRVARDETLMRHNASLIMTVHARLLWTDTPAAFLVSIRRASGPCHPEQRTFMRTCRETNRHI